MGFFNAIFGYKSSCMRGSNSVLFLQSPDIFGGVIREKRPKEAGLKNKTE